MTLTDAQKVTLGNHIRANEDPEIVSALANGQITKIRNWYNATASPDFWVFYGSVSVDEVRRSLDWDEIEDTAKMTAQRWKMFEILFSNHDYNPEEANNREALIRIFPGNAYPEEERMPNCRAAVLVDATRKATEAEKVLSEVATGPGGGNGSAQAQSAIAVFKGDLSNSDIGDAINATEP